jgi:hypothetical protein
MNSLLYDDSLVSDSNYSSTRFDHDRDFNSSIRSNNRDTLVKNVFQECMKLESKHRELLRKPNKIQPVRMPAEITIPATQSSHSSADSLDIIDISHKIEKIQHELYNKSLLTIEQMQPLSSTRPDTRGSLNVTYRALPIKHFIMGGYFKKPRPKTVEIKERNKELEKRHKSELNNTLPARAQNITSPNTAQHKPMWNDSYVMDLSMAENAISEFPEALPDIKPRVVKVDEIYSIRYLYRKSLHKSSEPQTRLNTTRSRIKSSIDYEARHYQQVKEKLQREREAKELEMAKKLTRWDGVMYQEDEIEADFPKQLRPNNAKFLWKYRNHGRSVFDIEDLSSKFK